MTLAPVSRRKIALTLAALPLLTVLPTRSLAMAPPQMRALDAARRLDRLNGLVVSIDGSVKVAAALRNGSLDAPASIKSVSKSVIAALTGIAIDRGVFTGTGQKIADILPESLPSRPDPRLHAITLDHLLTMRAGLERTSGPNYGAWVQSDDWVRDVLARPFVAEPGERFQYSTGSFHLLSAALTKASGRSALDLARAWLGAPLAIDIPAWTRDPQGIYLGGNNMALTPMAMLRFGELFRRDGLFGGVRVVSADWVRASWQPRAVSPWSGHEYGYGWFLTDMAGAAVRYARGYGGQMIYVVPSLRLTAVMVSDPTQPARSAGYVGDLHRLLTDTLMPLAHDT
jgi:CubicO group peptidase (beta-lactamase class C family)